MPSLQELFANTFNSAGLNYNASQGAYASAKAREGPYVPPDGKYTVKLTEIEPISGEYANDDGSKESFAKFVFHYEIQESLDGNSETIGKMISDQIFLGKDQEKNERAYGLIKFRCNEVLGSEVPDLLEAMAQLAERAPGTLWEASVVTGKVKSGKNAGQKRTNIYINKLIPSTSNPSQR